MRRSSRFGTSVAFRTAAFPRAPRSVRGRGDGRGFKPRNSRRLGGFALPAPVVLLVATGLLTATYAAGERPPPATDHDTRGQRVPIDRALPFARTPIDYLSEASADPFRRTFSGEDPPERPACPSANDEKARNGVSDVLPTANDDAADVRVDDDQRRRLLDLLRRLDISPHSQLLVFSKTALHQDLVGPENPRAIYFNDHTFVAWVRGSGVFEVASLDPLKGFLFYTVPIGASHHYRREDRCLTCHVSRFTFGIPGLLARSMQTDRAGRPRRGSADLVAPLPFAQRFGGWIVTAPGQHVPLRAPSHQGNLAGDRQVTVPDATLTRGSDVLAHQVFLHQVRGLNLLIRVGYEERLGIRSDAESLLLAHLLHAVSVDTKPPVGRDASENRPDAPAASVGNGASVSAPEKPAAHHRSPFARWFESLGPHDAQGRTLRALQWPDDDGFRYRLSYLVYSPAFRHLPSAARQRIWRGLRDALHGRMTVAPPLTARQRAEVLAILRGTRRCLPDDCRP